MSVTRVRLTYEEYISLPEDTRPCELINGELYMPPAPTRRHQRILINLLHAIDRFVREKDLGEVYIAPLDVVLDRARPLILRPDLLFVSHARRHILQERIEGAPDLVVEILSPGSALRDRTEKTVWYGQYGVREYWLVDPETRAIEVRRLSAEGYEPLGVYEFGQILTSEVLSGLALPVDSIFA